MTTIKITVDTEGKVTTKVEGGCGSSCADLTKPIRDALGETTSDRKLPEYYQQARQGLQVKG